MKSKAIFAVYSLLVVAMGAISITNALLLQAFAVPLHMVQAHGIADALDLATCEILNIAHSTFDYAEQRVKYPFNAPPSAEMRNYAIAYFDRDNKHLGTNIVTDHCSDCAQWNDPKKFDKKAAPNVVVEEIGVLA